MQVFSFVHVPTLSMIEFEDHHCAWLNNCVGKRNYRSFFTFITSSALLCIFVICSVIYELLFISRNQVQQPASFGDVFSQAPVSFVLSIYCFVLLWLVGGLTLYHCSLVLRGVSTHEQVSDGNNSSKRRGKADDYKIDKS